MSKLQEYQQILQNYGFVQTCQHQHIYSNGKSTVRLSQGLGGGLHWDSAESGGLRPSTLLKWMEARYGKD